MILKISLFNEQKRYPLPLPEMEKSLLAACRYLRVSTRAIHFYFSTPQRIRHLHQEFFSDGSLTDCMTFPLDPPGKDSEILGEIFLCPAQAFQVASSHGHTFHQELMLYAVHGILHLLGYEDTTATQARAMRKGEKAVLDHLRKKNLFPYQLPSSVKLII